MSKPYNRPVPPGPPPGPPGHTYGLRQPQPPQHFQRHFNSAYAQNAGAGYSQPELQHAKLADGSAVLFTYTQPSPSYAQQPFHHPPTIPCSGPPAHEHITFRIDGPPSTISPAFITHMQHAAEEYIKAHTPEALSNKASADAIARAIQPLVAQIKDVADRMAPPLPLKKQSCVEVAAADSASPLKRKLPPPQKEVAADTHRTHSHSSGTPSRSTTQVAQDKARSDYVTGIATKHLEDTFGFSKTTTLKRTILALLKFYGLPEDKDRDSTEWRAKQLTKLATRAAEAMMEDPPLPSP